MLILIIYSLFEYMKKMQFKSTSVRTDLGMLLVHVQHYSFSFISAMATGSIWSCVWQNIDYTNCNYIFKEPLILGKLKFVSGAWAWVELEGDLTGNSRLHFLFFSLHYTCVVEKVWVVCVYIWGINKGKRHKQQNWGEEVTGKFHEDIISILNLVKKIYGRKTWKKRVEEERHVLF